MGMPSGQSGTYFGTDVGKWGAEGAEFLFGPGEGGKFFFVYPTCLYSKCSDVCAKFKYG